MLAVEEISQSAPVRQLIKSPLDPRVIKIEPGFNPRDFRLQENLDHVAAYKRSIRARGVIEPLLVRLDVPTKSIMLVDGECRLRAVMELIDEGENIKGVPVIQRFGSSETERLLDAIHANTGKVLTKWEHGEAFRRFIRWGWTIEEVAQKTSFSERYVRESVELADAPDELKVLMSEQTITPGLALAAVRTYGSEAFQAVQPQIEEAKKAGTIAKRYKTKAVNIKKLMVGLLKDVTREELNDERFERVQVDRKKLMAIAKALRH